MGLNTFRNRSKDFSISYPSLKIDLHDEEFEQLIWTSQTNDVPMNG